MEFIVDILENLLLVFVGGGIVCVIAQLLIDLTKLTPARILVMYVSAGVLLFAIGLYEPLFSVFSSGVSVPLLGFGANIGRGVKEAIDATGPIGILSGGLTAASVGITVSLLLGFIFAVLFKTKSKRM